MAVPKSRTSKSRKGTRRSHLLRKATTPAPSKCPRCHEAKLPHRVCIHCGYYRDQEIIKMDEI